MITQLQDLLRRRRTDRRSTATHGDAGPLELLADRAPMNAQLWTDLAQGPILGVQVGCTPNIHRATVTAGLTWERVDIDDHTSRPFSLAARTATYPGRAERVARGVPALSQSPVGRTLRGMECRSSLIDLNGPLAVGMELQEAWTGADHAFTGILPNLVDQVLRAILVVKIDNEVAFAVVS
jgi:hypothetical protein